MVWFLLGPFGTFLVIVIIVRLLYYKFLVYFSLLFLSSSFDLLLCF